MKWLGFTPGIRGRTAAGKRIREAWLVRRSSLPASAACVVANGVRETLTSLLGTPVSVRLFEPIIPDVRGWESIARDALLYRVRCSVADAAVILRVSDASALAGAAFGEPRSFGERALSPIECEVIERTVNAVAANLSAICGAREAHPAERTGTIAGFVTYFELLLQKPIEGRIGIALSRDPKTDPRGSLDIGHVGNVRVAATASLDLGKYRASAIATLSVGTVLPIRAGDLRRCSLSVSGRPLARGACGVRNGRLAMTTETIRESA